MDRNYSQQLPLLAGVEAESILRIAVEKRKLAHTHIEEVYKATPEKYHKHIRLLPQKEKIWHNEFSLTPEQKEKGLISYQGCTYVETFRPYVDVEGRITQMIDVHKEHCASYTLDTYPEQIGDYWVMTCAFEGLNKHGQPFKTKERAIVGFGGTGVDSTNPIENASTSAVGRALSHGGFGILGSGLSSYEDMYIAITKQKALEKLNNGGKATPGSSGNQLSDQVERTGTQGAGTQQRSQGSVQTLQGSDRVPLSGNPSSSQQQGQSKSSHSPKTTTSRGGLTPGNPQEDQNPSKEKNVLVGRLMEATKGWPAADLKVRVQTWLNINNWNGRFNTLVIGQLRLVEEHVKKETRNSRAS